MKVLMPASDREKRLLLSVQRALLGTVPPTISAVTCGWNNDNIVLEFLVDSALDDEDRERCEVVATEVVADFSHETIASVFTVQASGGPKTPVEERWWAYRRS
jgi:hypothetical protein